jgi:type IV pilus assembly protein PilB
MLDGNEFIIQYLLDNGELSEQDLERARERANEGDGTALDALVELTKITTRDIALARAAVSEYPFLDLEAFEVNIRNAELMPRRTAQAIKAFPMFVLDGVATVAMNDPMDLQVIDQVRQHLRCDVDPVICDPVLLDRLIDRAYSLYRAPDESGDSNASSSQGSASSDEPNVVAVNQLLLAAIEAGASDLHINPDERELHIRLRVDGVLQRLDAMPLAAHQGIVQRFKVLGRMDLTQSRRPQDGKFRFSSGGNSVDVRLSLIPTVCGENVVCRLLRPTASISKIEDLGMSMDNTTRFKELVHRSHGMLLVTGPTGSGKTTTLYTALSDLNTPDRNIMTIEDPVEIRLPMLRQVQVNTEIGMTFAAALRSMLRQDPDVILVGEIRDEETARIAVSASMTGHLVLSTLHTNDSVGTVARMRDFGIPAYALNSALLGVLSQRLLRKVCEDCAEPYTPKPADLDAIGLHVDGALFRQGIGCTKCLNTGYRGRTGVHELLTLTASLRHLIEKSATLVELQNEAVRSGMKTLLEDGGEKAAIGLTTVSEVEKLRACMDASEETRDAA